MWNTVEQMQLTYIVMGQKIRKKNYLSFEINGARTIPRFLTGLMSIALECNTIHNYPF